jgi:hypothetical protein
MLQTRRTGRGKPHPCHGFEKKKQSAFVETSGLLHSLALIAIREMYHRVEVERGRQNRIG